MSALPRSLLEQVQGLLERTYAVAGALPDVGRFVIGDVGYRRFYTEHDDRVMGQFAVGYDLVWPPPTPATGRP